MLACVWYGRHACFGQCSRIGACAFWNSEKINANNSAATAHTNLTTHSLSHTLSKICHPPPCPVFLIMVPREVRGSSERNILCSRVVGTAGMHVLGSVRVSVRAFLGFLIHFGITLRVLRHPEA